MANFELVMPKLGESIIEATIVRWHKKEGDQVVEDESIADLATDKVDSEIPSPVEGIVTKLFYKEGDIVPVGKVIAIINMGGEEAAPNGTAIVAENVVAEAKTEAQPTAAPANVAETVVESDRFYSPLVRNIAKQENIPLSELEAVPGTGKDNRLTKQDILDYIKTRGSKPAVQTTAATEKPKVQAPAVTSSTGDVIIEMDRMRRLIADHMVMSKQVSPHVTSFIEVDVTNIVRWRDKIKDSFAKREGQKITYTPLFVEAAAKALREFPNVNASIDGYKIIQRKAINIGMAAALPDGNLIVPVIKNADQKNLLGIVKDVNDLADRARKNKLNPDDIAGGTFTITNFGTFDSLTGVPVINQPQVAILGIGTIKKRPWVLETADGDVIAIRHICMLSLSYDHRLVDGALAGMFIKRIQQLLEGFEVNTVI
ncbi:MAG: dihydrolipoamide acetyltransferase family protein [Lentimicrobiaceae bacterium]|jgi:2-oxoglutarate dehydrogenase E2 component (dihydrolipoamide succinyltransferase)